MKEQCRDFCMFIFAVDSRQRETLETSMFDLFMHLGSELIPCQFTAYDICNKFLFCVGRHVKSSGTWTTRGGEIADVYPK